MDRIENIVDFHDIYDFYYIPFWQTLWFKIIVGIACAIALTAIIYLIVTRRKKKITAWEWATQELAKLAGMQLSSKADYKKFYFALTVITKQYLHERYGWKVSDKTDEELVAWLELRCSKKLPTAPCGLNLPTWKRSDHKPMQICRQW